MEGMTKDGGEGRLRSLEARVESLERQVELLTCVLSGMESRRGGGSLPSPEALLKPYSDRVYAIGGEMLECASREQFERVRAKYKAVLAEVRERFDDAVYADFRARRNAQLLKCYEQVRMRWAVSPEREAVARGEVPLGRGVDYERYFPSSREALDYVVAHAASEGEARESAEGICRGYAGLNAAFYAGYAATEWRRARGLN